MWILSQTHHLGPAASSRDLRFSLILMVFVSPSSTSASWVLIFACVLKRFNFSSTKEDWKLFKTPKFFKNWGQTLNSKSFSISHFMVKAKKSHQTQNIWWFRSIHKKSQKIRRGFLLCMTFPKATQKEALLLLFINWDVTQKSSLLWL